MAYNSFLCEVFSDKVRNIAFCTKTLRTTNYMDIESQNSKNK